MVDLGAVNSPYVQLNDGIFTKETTLPEQCQQVPDDFCQNNVEIQC